jgi:peptidoglycan/LPS O-acetylase OafA/YrhL
MGVGHFGVQTFFMISGFVIHISLQNASSLRIFFFKRVKRLLIPATVLLPFVAIIARFSPVPEFRQSATFANLLTSMILFDPRYLNEIFGTNLSWITGVLWTLTIEIWFYIVSGFIFFKLSKRFYLQILACFASICTITDHETRFSVSGLAGGLQKILDLTGFPHFWWFVLGVIASSILRARDRGLVVFFLAVSVLTLIFTYNGYKDEKEGYSVFLALAFILASEITILSIALKNSLVDRVLSLRVLKFVGDNSYEMYLVHEVIGISLLAYFYKVFHFNSFAIVLYLFLFCILMIPLLSTIRSSVFSRINKRANAHRFANRLRV